MGLRSAESVVSTQTGGVLTKAASYEMWKACARVADRKGAAKRRTSSRGVQRAQRLCRGPGVSCRSYVRAGGWATHEERRQRSPSGSAEPPACSTAAAGKASPAAAAHRCAGPPPPRAGAARSRTAPATAAARTTSSMRTAPRIVAERRRQRQHRVGRELDRPTAPDQLRHRQHRDDRLCGLRRSASGPIREAASPGPANRAASAAAPSIRRSAQFPGRTPPRTPCRLVRRPQFRRCNSCPFAGRHTAQPAAQQRPGHRRRQPRERPHARRRRPAPPAAPTRAPAPRARRRLSRFAIAAAFCRKRIPPSRSSVRATSSPPRRATAVRHGSPQRGSCSSQRARPRSAQRHDGRASAARQLRVTALVVEEHHVQRDVRIRQSPGGARAAGSRSSARAIRHPPAAAPPAQR